MTVVGDSQRVVLLELVARGRFMAGMFFPFTKGWLIQRGTPVRWLRASVDPAALLEAEAVARRLVAQLEAICAESPPTHLIASHHLAAAALPALTVAFDRCRFGLLDMDYSLRNDHGDLPEQLAILEPTQQSLEAWLSGNASPGVGAGPLLAVAQPDYAFERIGAPTADTQFCYLLGGPECNYRRPLRTSRFFRDRPDLRLPETWGCAFCVIPRCDPRERTELPLTNLLQRQLAQLAATWPEPRLQLVISGTDLLDVPEQLARAAAAEGLPRTQFLLPYRADRLLATLDQIRAAGRELGQAGHTLCLHLVGIESFSSRQLDRYHKGYPPEVNLVAIRTLQDLEAEQPEVFSVREFRGLSSILFDPWTSLGDVALNLAVAELFELEEFLGKLLSSRVRLTDGLPLTEAARADGLLRESYDDPVLDTARRNLYADELPWVFADPRLEALNRVTTLLDADPGVLARLGRAPWHAELEAWRKQRGVSSLALARSLTRTAMDHDEPLSEEQLIQKTIDGEQAPAPRLESGLPVSEWLGQSWECGALRAGLKPVLKLEGGLSEADRQRVEESLRSELGELTVRRLADTASGLFLGRDQEEVEAVVELSCRLRSPETVGPSDKEGLITEIGVRLGYPRCCAEAYATRAARVDHCDGWLVLRRRLEQPGPVLPALNPAYLPYVPCSMGCVRTRKDLERLCLAREWEERLALPTVVFLDSTVETAILRPTAGLEELTSQNTGTSIYRLSYEIEGFGIISGRRRAALERGDTLEIEPGLLRILSGKREVAWFPLEAFVWWGERAFHPEFWRSCVDAAERHQRFSAPTSTDAVTSAALPDPHAGTRRRLARRLRVVFERSVRAHPQLFGGLRLVSIEQRATGSDWGEIELSLGAGERRLRLLVVPNRPETPALSRARGLALIHDAATPPKDRHEEQALRHLLEELSWEVDFGG